MGIRAIYVVIKQLVERYGSLYRLSLLIWFFQNISQQCCSAPLPIGSRGDNWRAWNAHHSASAPVWGRLQGLVCFAWGSFGSAEWNWIANQRIVSKKDTADGVSVHCEQPKNKHGSPNSGLQISRQSIDSAIEAALKSLSEVLARTKSTTQCNATVWIRYLLA